MFHCVFHGADFIGNTFKKLAHKSVCLYTNFKEVYPIRKGKEGLYNMNQEVISAIFIALCNEYVKEFQ